MNRNQRPVLRVSAPGKIILFGEHSVVHKRLAVAVSVGLRTTLHLYPTDGVISLDLPDIGLKRSWSTGEVRGWLADLVQNDWRQPTPPSVPLKQRLLDAVTAHVPDLTSSQHTLALTSFFYLYASLCPQFPGMHIEVRSELPTGAGLGSSAAYGVSLVAALIYQCHLAESISAGQQLRPDADTLAIVSDWALACDTIIHGNASGVDNATCTHGGAVTFRPGQIAALETGQLVRVLLVDTRVQRDTRSLVQRVHDRLQDERFGSVVESVLDAMDALAESGCTALSTGDQPALARLVSMNQGLLYTLGVSHPTLDAICLTASRHGLAAKLTGAGGGGFALVLVPNDTPADRVSQLTRELGSLGFSVHNVGIGGAGVLLEKLSS